MCFLYRAQKYGDQLQENFTNVKKMNLFDQFRAQAYIVALML
jgi:hypothetical protein